jgi:hypothetical protein
MAEDRGGILSALMQTWPARASKGILEALMLPGDVAQGRAQVPSSQGILGSVPYESPEGQQTLGRATDLAGVLMGGSYAAPPVAGSIGMGVRTKSKEPLLVPIKDIEHGESAMPGGKLTWPGAQDLIQEYASRPTPLPPIRAVPPDIDNPKWLIEDGSHRLEAAKLRGDKYILIEP